MTSQLQVQHGSPVPLTGLLTGHVTKAAAGLIGCLLCRRLPDGTLLRASIVEAEAYRMDDPGCHAYRGKTPRNVVMFGPPGRLYVYFTYGMWHCCNVVCEAEGTAAAVLLRAASPLAPHDGSGEGERLRLSGPGLLCRGLSIDRELNGADLFNQGGPVWLERPADWTQAELAWTTRIGFSFPDPHEWRCYRPGHPDVSPGRPGVIRRSRGSRAGGSG